MLILSTGLFCVQCEFAGDRRTGRPCGTAAIAPARTPQEKKGEGPATPNRRTRYRERRLTGKVDVARFYLSSESLVFAKLST